MTSNTAPLDPAEREKVIRDTLRRVDLIPSRMTHAKSVEQVITTAHLPYSDGPLALAVLSNALYASWPSSTISNAGGTVAVATSIDPVMHGQRVDFVATDEAAAAHTKGV